MSFRYLRLVLHASALSSLILLALAGCGSGESSITASAASASSTKALLRKPAHFGADTAASYTTAVQQLYIAYFGRPADPEGLANFSAALSLSGAPADIQSLNVAYGSHPQVRALIDAFGTSPESARLYAGDTAAFVTAIYRNVLSRLPAKDGLDFWIDAIDRVGLTRGNAALAIMAGALSNQTPQGLLDADLITKRIAIASSFTSTLSAAALTSGYRGPVAAATAREMLARVSNETVPSAFESNVRYTIGAITGTVPSASGSVERDLSNYATVALDLFTAPAVDTHTAVVGAIQQLTDSRFVLTNAYWDFSRNGADRFRAGPQYLLSWNGTELKESNSLVNGGIPSMYFAETTGAVADMNGDGILDVVLGGNGPDGEGNIGEPSYLLLSSGQGYARRTLPNGALMPGRHSWVHGGTTVKLRNRTGRSVFLDDITYGPAYLIDVSSATPAIQSGMLPSYVGARTSVDWAYTADLIVTASLGTDLDGDGVDELILGTTISYTAALTNPALNEMTTVVLRQDENGSFARAQPLRLPDGPFPKRNCWDNAIGGMKNDCGGVTIKQIAAADMNKDGKPDLLVTHHIYGQDASGNFYTGSYPQILINQGGLQFQDVTTAYFGKDMTDLSGGYVHSHPFDLNGDGCIDIVLRGDANNGKKPRVFLNDCSGFMVEFSDEFQRLMSGIDQYDRMNGGIPVKLDGRPAVILWHSIGTGYPLKFHAVRFPVNLPTPVNRRLSYVAS